MKTEAIYLVNKGDSKKAFQNKELIISSPSPDEVLIQSEAFGLNYADVMARLGLYKAAPPRPAVLGYELVGKVVEVGQNVDTSLIGKRVLAFCRFGGYGKHILTKKDAIVEVNEEPAELLMGLCTQAVTAYYMAEYLAPIHENEHVLVHAAAGGVGTILCQLAKNKGAIVYAKTGDESKRKVLENLKVDHIINYRQGDYESLVKVKLGSKKLDVSFNPAGGSTYKKDMRLLGAGGRLFLFGGSELSSGKSGIFSKLKFVQKMGFHSPIGQMVQSKSVIGVNMLQIADEKPEVMNICLSEVFHLFKNGKITPQIGGVFSVKDIHIAHELLEKGKTTGKLTIKW